jgi:hypothetical protein
VWNGGLKSTQNMESPLAPSLNFGEKGQARRTRPISRPVSITVLTQAKSNVASN